MRIKSKFLRASLVCLAFSFLLLTGIFAASPREMYENGVVSDGNVTFGDERDGIVSDVSEGGNIISDAGELLTDMLSPSTTEAPMTTGTSEITSTSQTENVENTTGAEEDGGAAWGIIIAVVVVIAVVIIIFLLMPKRN